MWPISTFTSQYQYIIAKRTGIKREQGQISTTCKGDYYQNKQNEKCMADRRIHIEILWVNEQTYINKKLTSALSGCRSLPCISTECVEQIHTATRADPGFWNGGWIFAGNNVREIKYYFKYWGIRKKRKKEAQKKGGENSPISPPLDPRLRHNCQDFGIEEPYWRLFSRWYIQHRLKSFQFFNW